MYKNNEKYHPNLGPPTTYLNSDLLLIHSTDVYWASTMAQALPDTAVKNRQGSWWYEVYTGGGEIEIKKLMFKRQRK